MNKSLIVGVLQRAGDLLDVGDDERERQGNAPGVSLAKRAVGSVLHDQEWSGIGHAKVEDAHDMGMHQVSNGLRLGQEMVHHVGGQLRVQDFNSGLRFEIEMLSQVHVSKAAAPQQAQETIIPQLLSRSISHGEFPPDMTTVSQTLL